MCSKTNYIKFNPYLFGLALLIIFTSLSFFTDTTQGQSATESWKQNFYRWYTNVDELTPTDPWPAGSVDLGENTALTLADQPPRPEAVQRLRISLQLIDNGPSVGQRFKLQFVQGQNCSALTNWQDVGTPGSNTVWRGYNNPSAQTIDDANLPASLLSISDYPQTYEEANPTAASPNVIAIGQDAEWDWVLQNHNAPYDTPYCFRMVHLDGTPLDFYDNYPLSFTDAPYTPKSQNWRWYGDETNETPSTALAAENTAPTDVVAGDKIKLRFTIKETLAGPGTDIKMKLQFSTTSDFSSDINNLVEIGSCVTTSLWCYADGVDADDDSITSLVLTDSDATGTHNESGTTSSTYDPAANEATEWEFTIMSSGSDANTPYYFRAYDVTNNLAVPLNTSETYPSLELEQTLIFTITGLNSGTVTEGITTDITTTATTIPFATLSFGVETEAAQRLTVITSAPNGYQITVKHRQALTNTYSDTINAISATNASPTAWPTDPSPGGWGYHTGDGSLAGASARFSANDSYAGFSTSLEEIVFTGTAVGSESHDFVYKIEITNQQPAGNYSNEVVFVITPTF